MQSCAGSLDRAVGDEEDGEGEKMDDLISREALIKKIFPYGMPDDGNYPINAKAVMKAIMDAEAVKE